MIGSNRRFLEKLRLRVLLLLLLLLLGYAAPGGEIHAQTDTSQIGVSPERIKVTAKAGNCHTESVTITTAAAAIPKLDIAILIDVTGSMDDIIREVTTNARQITTDLHAIAPDVQFALGTFSDYPQENLLLSLMGGLLGVEEFGSGEDYPWQLEQDFTKDGSKIKTALERITLRDGGDTPESYLRALYEAQFISWRPDARRLIILFGDSVPHDPDPGRDNTPGSDDDLTLNRVVTQLRKANIAVLSIYSDDDAVANFYNTLSKNTNGAALRLEEAKQAPSAITNMVQEAAAAINILTLKPTGSNTGWLSWQPDTFENVGYEQSKSFQLEICVPAGTATGEYTIPLEVLADGENIGTIPVQIKVPQSPGIPWWGWLLLPLVLLLL
ncbi:MAG: VWA domain-containing protein, partial [Caldilineae bacterium]